MNKSKITLLFTTYSSWFSILFFLLLIGCKSSKEDLRKSINEDPSKSSWLKMMKSEEMMELNLTTDIAALIETKDTETYQTATLACVGKDSMHWSLPIKACARGKTRKGYCDFPPLKINFKKQDLIDAGYKSYDVYKLVTHCKEEAENEELLLKEYLVYKIYNILTEFSLDTRLVKMNYLDTNKQLERTKKKAFLIETIEEFANRHQHDILEPTENKLKAIDAQQYKILTLFQYMIGNTDWNLSLQHNIRLMTKNKQSPVPIPYDFDYCGLVNAPYALPHPDLPIKKVRERLFQWRSKKFEFEDTFQLFITKKSEILAFCNTFPHLSEASKEDIKDYLLSFYSIIENPESVKKHLLKK